MFLETFVVSELLDTTHHENNLYKTFSLCCVSFRIAYNFSPFLLKTYSEN